VAKIKYERLDAEISPHSSRRERGVLRPGQDDQPDPAIPRVPILLATRSLNSLTDSAIRQEFIHPEEQGTNLSEQSSTEIALRAERCSETASGLAVSSNNGERSALYPWILESVKRRLYADSQCAATGEAVDDPSGIHRLHEASREACPDLSSASGKDLAGTSLNRLDGEVRLIRAKLAKEN